MSGGESNNGVGGAGANGGAGRNRLTCHAVVRVGDVDSPLLVHYLDESQTGNWIVEGVNHAPVAVSGQTRDIGNAISLQCFSNDLSNGEPHGEPPGRDVR